MAGQPAASREHSFGYLFFFPTDSNKRQSQLPGPCRRFLPVFLTRQRCGQIDLSIFLFAQNPGTTIGGDHGDPADTPVPAFEANSS